MKGLEKSFKEAALAVIAAENGMISPQKLVHIFSDWVNSPGVSIRKKLEEALPEENRALLDLLGSESVEDEPQNRSIEVLMDSVNRIKEQTRMAVGTPTGQGDNTSDRLITDETPGKYMIQGELARGGAGRVLIALDRHIGREIAMKELLLDLRDKRDGKIRNDPQTVSLRNRFLREARVTGQLEHPSIVPVYEIGRHPDGIFYYTMRMVKGKTLNQAIKICNSLEDRLELLPHFYNICNAVAYAHSKGVINRDLKPSNVMIGEFGETVVLDWGLAKVKGQQDMGAEKLQTGLRLFLDADVGKTVVGYAIGTPSYMPPEQAEGKVDDIDETSDTYSLGAILYQLLTGDPPYSGKTASEILRKVVDTDPQKATSVDRNIPPELAAIAHKAMSKKKKDRYSSVTELIDELNSFMSGGNVKVYEYSSMEILKRFASKNKAVFISSILILVMLSLSTLMIAWYYDREVTAKKTAQKEKIVSQYRTAQAFNEKAARLETQKQFLSSRIYAAASLYFNPANRNSPEYVSWFRKNFKDADVLLSDAASRFYHRHFHRGALLETGFDTDCTITALAVSSDLSSIFAGCGNGDVAVYSYPGLKEKNRFKTGSQIDSIDLTEDGKFAAFAGISGAVTIADLEKNTVSTLIKKGLGIKSIRFSPDGSQLLSCGIDSIIKIVNLTSGEAVEIKGHAGIVNDAVFVDEKTILSASADSTVRIWDKDAGSEISLYQTDEEVKKLAVINGPGIILAGTENGSVIVLSKVDLRFIRKLSYHGSPVTSIDVSSDGSLFLTSERERKSVVWDAGKMIPLFALEGHRNNMTAAVFDNNSEKIITVGTEGFIRVWARHDRKEIKTFSYDFQKIRKGSISKNGKLALLPKNDLIVVQDMKEGTRKEIQLQTPVLDVDISPDGSKIAAACWDTIVRIIDVETGSFVNELKGNENAVSAVKFSGDGRYVASAGRDGSISIFSSQGGERIAYKCASGGATGVSFSSDSTLVSGICDNGDIPVLKVPAMEVVKLIKNYEKKPVSVSFTADNGSIMTGYLAHSPEVTGINSDTLISLPGQHGSVTATAVSDDGKFGATSSTDSLVQLWDMAEHKPFLTITTQKDPGCIMFMPDSSSLGVCDGGTIKFYPLSTPDLEMDPLTLLKKMEKEAGMKLKDFYLEAGM